MIQPEEFLDAARARGVGLYAGVPCSFLTPFINCAIDDDRLRYLSAANEGDAVAAAAGAAIGGQRACAMMQNSGLGNAVSPLTSLTHVFRIPILLICTHRGAPGMPDEPQHELMGQITGPMLDTVRLPWEPFPRESGQVAAALDRAVDRMRREERPYAFLMAKGSVAAHALRRQGLGLRGGRGELRRDRLSAPAERPSRTQALGRILARTPAASTVLIASTGYTGRELYALDDRPNQLYMVGSMGCASSLGLGLSLARPDLTVVVIDGDGAALMRLGNFATIGAYGGANLCHLV
ncbi:MAG: phosphonopyruvate decarboxylase, partial [Candidatus Methylomirabilota bacterium]